MHIRPQLNDHCLLGARQDFVLGSRQRLEIQHVTWSELPIDAQAGVDSRWERVDHPTSSGGTHDVIRARIA